MSSLRTKIYHLLRRSEKYTKTDMIYLAKGGFWLTLGQIISSASAFLLAIAFANLIPPETYGTYKYILSIVSILMIATLPGMNMAVTRSIAIGNEGIIKNAVKTKIKWGILASIGCFIAAGYYWINDNQTIFISLLIASIFLPLIDSFALYGPYLQGRKLFKSYTKFNIISNIIATTALIITLFSTTNIFMLILAYFISWTITRFILFQIIIKKYPPNQKTDPTTISYGKHLSLMNIIGSIAGNLDKILLFHFLGATQVAIYFFALAPVRQIRAVIENISPLAFPKFAQREISDIKKSVCDKMTKLFILMVLIIFTYILISPFIFKTLFPQYIEAIILSQIYSITLIIMPGMIFGIIFSSHAKKREMYITNISNPIIRIILYIILIPIFGIMGAIIAIIIGEFIKFLLLTILFKKIT